MSLTSQLANHVRQQWGRIVRAESAGAVAVSVSIAVAAMELGGCGRPEPVRNASSCGATRFVEPYSAVDPCSADAVLVSAAAAIFSYRPAEQRDTATAFAAATPLFALGYAERIGASAGVLAPVTGATWARWRSTHVAVTATARITDDDHPADAVNQVSRVVAVTLRPGDEPQHSLVAYMRVTRTDADQPWLVTDVEVK